MNHYESEAITRFKDGKAIERVLRWMRADFGSGDARRHQHVRIWATVVMLTAAKLLGATSATLVKYATSGEVSGDYEAVVGYAGIIVQ